MQCPVPLSCRGVPCSFCTFGGARVQSAARHRLSGVTPPRTPELTLNSLPQRLRRGGTRNQRGCCSHQQPHLSSRYTVDTQPWVMHAKLALDPFSSPSPVAPNQLIISDPTLRPVPSTHRMRPGTFPNSRIQLDRIQDAASLGYSAEKVNTTTRPSHQQKVLPKQNNSGHEEKEND